MFLYRKSLIHNPKISVLEIRTKTNFLSPILKPSIKNRYPSGRRFGLYLGCQPPLPVDHSPGGDATLGIYIHYKTDLFLKPHSISKKKQGYDRLYNLLECQFSASRPTVWLTCRGGCTHPQIRTALREIPKNQGFLISIQPYNRSIG